MMVPEPAPQRGSPLPPSRRRAPARAQPALRAPARASPPAWSAPEAAAAAASSVDSLVRTLTASAPRRCTAAVRRIEDIVREELRPLLKEWLDANLPPLVERLVRAEIERVVGRAVP